MPPSRRYIIIGGLVIATIVCFFVLLPCTLREIGSRGVLGRDISMWRQVYATIRIYQMNHGVYPASLDAPDFKSSLDPSLVPFLREGRLAYYPPAVDSPPTFIIVHMTTPRGDYSWQLDGTPLYPKIK